MKLLAHQKKKYGSVLPVEIQSGMELTAIACFARLANFNANQEMRYSDVMKIVMVVISLSILHRSLNRLFLLPGKLKFIIS